MWSFLSGSFLNPWMLAGAALGSAPIIIHLLNRRRFRTVVWAAMEFLLASHRRNHQRLRLEQILLMILRALILILLALAMSRPIAYAARAFLGRLAAPSTHAVIVLDNSFSLGARNSDGASRFERAQTLASSLLRRRTSTGDTASLLVFNRRPEAVVETPTLPESAAQEIATVSLSHSSTDVPSALRRALELATQAKSPRRDIYVITDLQRLGWRPEALADDTDLRAALQKAKGQVRWFLLDVGEEEAENLGIGEWACDSALVRTHAEVRFRARVVHFGTQPAEGLTARFLVDGEEQPEHPAPFSLQPGETRELVFTHTFPDRSPHVVSVELSRDLLPVDNLRHLSVQPRDSVRVLLADGDPGLEPTGGETFALRAALEPPGLRALGLEPFLLTTVVRDLNLLGELDDYDVVILANVPSLDDAEWRRKLKQWVRRGGALIIFVGDKVRPADYNLQLFEQGQGLLPAELDTVQTHESEPLHLDSRTVRPPLSSDYRKKPERLGSALFHRIYTLRGAEESREVRVLCRFTNRAPALIEKQFGSGRVLLVTTTCDRDWNDLPPRPAYLLLMQDLVRGLAGSALGGRSLEVGDLIRRRIGLEMLRQRFTLERPGSDEPIPLAPERGTGGAILRYADTARPGAYVLRVQRGGPATVLDRFAVNVPVEEGDLRRISPAEIRRRLPDFQFTIARSLSDLEATPSAASQPGEWTDPLLLIVLALIALETVLAQRFGH